MRHIAFLAACAALSAAAPAFAQTTVTKILDNGPDADKKVLVIIGDGYTAADLPAFRAYVQNALIDGVFTQDEFMRSHHTAFNIYRVDAVSPQSGVSIRRYSSGCGTTEKSDDVLDTTCTATSSSPCYTHNTAFDFVFTDCWGRCWMEGSANTSSALNAVLDAYVPKRDFEVRVLNVLTGEMGGCGGSGGLTVTSGSSWTVLAHEMGHMTAGLFDEYTASAYASTSYPSSVNTKNCSTTLSASGVDWSDLLTPGISLPTTFNATTMDPDQTVGMFEGCKTYGKSVYRPVNDCRMRFNNNQFCPVCRRTLGDTLSGFVDQADDYVAQSNVPGASCLAAEGGIATYDSGADVLNASASSLSLLCPARRVQQNGAFSNRLLGQAWVVDRSPTQDVCCQLFARTPGGTLAEGDLVCSTGASTSAQVLRLDFPKVAMPYTFAHYAMRCTLPASSSGASSSVLTYRIGQQLY